MSTKIAQAKPTAAWEIVWERPDFTLDIQYGLETSFDDSGRKLYRAWCNYTLGGELVRKESDVYLACDKADPVFATNQTMFMGQSGREKLIHDAALVRGAMLATERSPLDMEKIAMDMHQEARLAYTDWQRQEEARCARQIDDEAARVLMRQWLRGAELLMADEDQAALAHLRRVLAAPSKR